MILSVAYHSHEPLAALAADLARQNRWPALWLVVHNSPLSAPPIARQGALARLPLQLLDGREGDGFGAGCNRGLDWLAQRHWRGWVWLLNPDTALPEADLLERFAALLAVQPAQALLGTAVRSDDGQLEASGGWIDPGLDFRRRRLHGGLLEVARSTPLALHWLSGCSLALRPAAQPTPPRFDPALPLYYEDIDLCLRMTAAGAICLWSSAVAIGHRRGRGSGGDPQRRQRLATLSYWHFLQRHTPAWVRWLRGGRLLALALLRLPLQPRRSLAVLRGWAVAVGTPLR